MNTDLHSPEDNTCCAGIQVGSGFPDFHCFGCSSRPGGNLTVELGTEIVNVGDASCSLSDILLHVDLPLDPCENLGYLQKYQKAVNTGGVEVGASSSFVVSPGRKSGLSPLDLAVDQMNAQNCIPSPVRGAISLVSGHDGLESLPNLSAGTDRHELKQKKSERGVNSHLDGSNEDAIHEDECLVSDSQTHGKSSSDSFIPEKRSRKILLKQNNCVYKRRKVRNSVTLLPEHAQMALGKESLPRGQFDSSRLVEIEKNENLLETILIYKNHDKRPISGPDTRYLEQNEELLETKVNCMVYDKRPIAVHQTRYAEKNGNFSETGLTHKRHGKRDYSSSNKVPKVEENETCLETPINFRVPASSQSGFSLCFSGIGQEDRNNESVVEVNCKTRSDSEVCASLCNQGGTPLRKLPCKLEIITDANQGEMTVLDASVSTRAGATEAAGQRDLEKEWCISILKGYRLLALSSGKCAATVHPGVVGDGRCSKTCKLCGSMEDSTGTLICDMCEESFHLTCCNPKARSIPVDDDWYCPTCRRRKKKPVSKSSIESRDHQDRLKFQTAVPNKAVQDKASEDKSDLFWRMLRDDEAYTTQVRIGKEYQVDVPGWTGVVTDTSESPFMGQLISSEEMLLEEELAKQNLKNGVWPKDWKPAKSLLPGSKENWLQCQNLLYNEGELCPDGRKAKKDIFCGKWRRAPLSEVQNDGWDCSCAVVWDPFHADCAVPQELETEEILRRLKTSGMVCEK